MNFPVRVSAEQFSGGIFLNDIQQFGFGTGPIVMDNVQCDMAIYTSLDQCQFGGFLQTDCNHSEDADCECNEPPGNTTPVSTLSVTTVSTTTGPSTIRPTLAAGTCIHSIVEYQ